MSLLRVESLTKAFGGLAAVNDVSFEVEIGERIGLIGPNGAGKTTLFNCLTGVEQLTSGKVYFKGKDISKLSPHKICRMGMARTFQLIRIFPQMSVLENVMIGGMYGKGIDKNRAEKEALELLEFIGMGFPEKRDVIARTLSYPEQKQLEVIRAMATGPALLLLDELVAGLTPTEVDAVMSLLHRIEEKEITIILVEHIMRMVMRACQRIIVLHHGEKIGDASTKEIARDENVIKAYLGEEYLIA